MQNTLKPDRRAQMLTDTVSNSFEIMVGAYFLTISSFDQFQRVSASISKNIFHVCSSFALR